MSDLEQDVRGLIQADAEAFESLRPAGPPTMPIAVKRRVRKRQTWTVLLAAAMASLVTVGTAWLIPSLPRETETRPTGLPLAGSNVVELPPPGEAKAVFLADGTPVFVVAHQDGTASVIEAFSGHVPYGMKKLVWWCPSARWFEDPFHGSKYDEYGGWREGPAGNGLSIYRVEMVDHARLRVDAEAKITSPVELGPGRVAIHAKGPPPAGPFCDPGSESQAVFHRFAAKDETPVEKLKSSPEGWAFVRGDLLLQKKRQPQLCSLHAPRESFSCVEVYAPFFEDQQRLGPFESTTLEGPWVVRVHGGEIFDLAVPITPDMATG